jgi:hypothetical protein
VYRVRGDLERDLIQSVAEPGYVDILEDTRDYTLVRARHLMDRADRKGVAPLEKRFGVQLTDDVADFYRRWNGGVLIFRNIYIVFPVRLIERTAKELRKAHGLSSALPWRVLRFCSVEEGDHLALRQNGVGWHVIWASHEYDEAEFLEPEDPAVDARRVLDQSFAAWLQRMDATDGWPLSEQLLLLGEEPPLERVE